MSEGRQARSFYEFGPFVLDEGRRRLLRGGGETAPLTRKEFETLLVLVRAGGRVVEKGELMEAVWPDAHVEEGNLAVHISKLRAKLGRAEGGGPYIETEAVRGYRLTAGVRELEDVDLVFRKRTRARIVTEEIEETEGPAQGARRVSSRRRALALTAAAILLLAASVAATLSYSSWRGAARGEPAADVRTLAVFPFTLINPGPEDEYMGLAMADALTTRLSNVRQVVVRPTSAVRRAAGPGGGPAAGGRRLGVEAVLEGRIQKSDGRLRVTAQLVRTADEVSLWAGTFEAPLTDVFAVQDAVSEQLAAALALNLTAGERATLVRRYTADPEAYRLYAIGRSYWSRRDYDGMVMAEAFFRQAIKRDPHFALAYVGLADTLATRGAREETHRAQQKALELAPDLGEAYASRGFAHMFHRWDWEAADRDLRRAIELSPGYGAAHQWLATLLAIRGRTDEAKAAMGRALEIDPQSPNFLADMGQLHYFAREYPEAEEYCRRALEVAPDFVFAHQHLAFVYMKTGRGDEAVDALLRTGQMWHGKSRYPDAETVARQRLGHRQHLRRTGLAGHLRGVIKMLRESLPAEGGAAYSLALNYALLGEREEALRQLERAFAERGIMATFAYADPAFDDLRGDPRYQSLMRGAGLAP